MSKNTLHIPHTLAGLEGAECYLTAAATTALRQSDYECLGGLASNLAAVRDAVAVLGLGSVPAAVDVCLAAIGARRRQYPGLG